MTYYKKKYNLDNNSYKNSNYYGDTNISLPIYPKLRDNEIKKICEIITKFEKNEK